MSGSFDGCEVAGQVSAQPGRGFLGGVEQRFVDEVLVGDRAHRLASGLDLLGVQRGGVEADGPGLVGPFGVQRMGVDSVALGRSGVRRGVAFQLGDRARVRLGAVVVVAPHAHQLGELGADLAAALREPLPHLIGHAGQVEDPRPPVDPADTEATGQLDPQRRVVDRADAALLELQEPSVQRQPPPRAVLDLGGDDRVGVQLGVDRPRRVLTEQRRGHAEGVDLEHAVAAAAGHRPVPFEPAERGIHGGVMGREHLGPHPGMRGQRPQHRHRLRRRERGVEPPSRRVTEPPPQQAAGHRVVTVEHRAELLARHGAVHPEAGAPPTPPPPRGLVGIQVVVHRPRPRPGRSRSSANSA